MATKLDDISEAIGELRAEVKNLGQKIDRADQNALDTSDKAAEHRSAIHKRVEEIADEVGEVKTDMTVLKVTVADTKAVTDEVKLWKAQGKGALLVVGIASAAISSAVVGFLAYWWDVIMRLLRSG
jgi:predicted  nucleic acid-binding Zn-ribbon protein